MAKVFLPNVLRNKSGLTSHARIIVVILIFILVGASAAAIYGHYRKQSASKYKVVCSDQVLKKSSELLAASKIQDLKTVVQGIQSTKDYDQDPNCLYVTTVYFISSSDAQNAKQSLEKLETVYDEKKGYNKNLGSNIQTVDSLKQAVSYLQKAAEQFQENTKQFIKGNSTR